MKTRDEILAILRALLPELRERYGVRSLSLFGSAARDEMTETSDVDVLVEFRTTPTLFEFIRLRDEIAVSVGLDVDLAMKSALQRDIAVRALREEVPV